MMCSRGVNRSTNISDSEKFQVRFALRSVSRYFVGYFLDMPLVPDIIPAFLDLISLLTTTQWPISHCAVSLCPLLAENI